MANTTPMQMFEIQAEGGNSSDFIMKLAGLVLSLPTADPHVVGQVWLNSGVMTVSAG